MPVIVLTVPQNPVEVDPGKGIHGVLAMPFSGFDLMTRIAQRAQEAAAATPTGSTRIISCSRPRAASARRRIAFNLAVALGQLEQRTVLIDGSLQFGDLRALLKVPIDAPSILDLPTDRIAESDLSDVLWRDPSGIDILLAPPRIEMAEMVTPRDIDKIAVAAAARVRHDRRRHVARSSTTSTSLFLDASDTILEVVTYDSTTIHNTIAMADTFRLDRLPGVKVRYLVNRADSAGGINAGHLARALGRVPEQPCLRRPLVVRSNNEGVPFVLADPTARSARTWQGRRELLGPRGRHGGAGA